MTILDDIALCTCDDWMISVSNQSYLLLYENLRVITYQYKNHMFYRPNHCKQEDTSVFF